MNGPTKLSLAVVLALIGGNAFALGLGSIQVKSGLNQPLDAEIAVSTESAAETAGLNVSMASAEDFDRVGLSRGRVSIPIDFAVSTNSRGQAVIKLTTKEAVREPFLDFLIQVNWPKGKLLREYTVLLDPPITAPSRGTPAQVTPAKEAAPAPATKLAVQEKQPKPKATTVKPPKSQASEPKQPPAPKPAAPSAAPRTAAAGDYGPVAEGETLSEVARATRPDESTNINQMMLAMLKANPNAFYKDNINALKRGAILRIPSGEELKATGNAAAAAAAVRDQNDSWTTGAAVAKPTVVANAGAPKNTPAPKADTKSTGKPNEHLALVPPRAGKEGSADHPGPSSGTGASGDSKADLARTKEALASREQEATELKSRVKQLEDLNSKDQRLLTLKESEIAELQAKLKELQSKATATTAPTTKPAETPSTSTKPAETAATKPGEAGTKTEPKLTAQDIWGNIAASEKAGSKPAGTTTAPSTTATTPSTSTTPATTGSTTPSTTAATTTPSTTTPSTTTPSTTASTTPSTTSSTTPGATTSTAGTATTPSTTSSTTPSATTSTSPTTTSTGTTVTPVTTPSTSAPASLSTTPPATTASTVTKPAPPTTTPKPTPTVTTEPPWWQSNMVLLGGGVGLLLIGLLALMRFMRKPKPVLMPVGGADEFEEHAVVTGDEEHHLLDALAQNPGDAHLSLELLNLYYSQRDAAKFEAAAEAMYAHIADPTQPEWRQVKAMGEELCPHNPLFSGSDDLGLAAHGHQDHTVFGHYDAGTAGRDDFDLGGHDGHETKAMPVEDNFDFDLTDHTASAAAPANDLGFAHEPPPPPPPRAAPAPAPAPAATVRAPIHAPAPAAKPAEDFFAGEDAIGTKLDLAKAYLDMGDPEGARSMLDEVMAEGNDAQKGEARKLLAEIR